MIIEAADRQGSFTDVDEAAAIVYAVDHGARIINLSLGGPTTSSTERRAIDYAVAKGALLVAAVGNSHARREPGRVSGRAPPARRLARRRRTRPLSRGLDEVGARASFSEHGHAHLPRSARRSRLRRRLRRLLRVALSAGQPSGLGHRASTATPAARRSPRRRSPAPRRSSGRRTHGSARRRSQRFSSAQPPAEESGARSSATASSTSLQPWRRRRHTRPARARLRPRRARSGRRGARRRSSMRS